MANIKIDNLQKIYPDGFVAVKDFSIDIEDGEFIIFVGPSGCGKTTTLRMIAGLEKATNGHIYIDNKLVNNIPPKNRDIAMVFQSYALYPNMNVFNNIAFGLKIRKTPKDIINQKVLEAAKILGIEHLLHRLPKALSGGQKQRVAMGRALVRNAKVFLMDEPLSNLDAKLRVLMRSEISKLHQKLATTFIYVTHDQVEAMTLGTRIVVMKNGEIQQIDTPKNLYQNPCNLFVASFLGSPQMNLLNCNLIKDNEDILALCGDYKINVPIAKGKFLEKNGYIGKELVVGIRPEDVYHQESYEKREGDTLIETKIVVTELLGPEILLYLDLGSENFIARVSPNNENKPGDLAKFILNGQKLYFFDKDSQLTIKN